MTVAPIAIAAISSMPPRISQRIGPPRKADAILNEVVPIEAIERRSLPRNELPEAEFSYLRPMTCYRAEMELTLASLVNERLAR